jgi:hypothetical protein
MALLLKVDAVANRPTGTTHGMSGLNLQVFVTDPNGDPYPGLTQEHFKVQAMDSGNLNIVDVEVDHVSEMHRQDPGRWPAGLYRMGLTIPGGFFADKYYTLFVQVRRFTSSGGFLVFGRARPDQGQTMTGIDYR